jgi:hypothetical protein
VDGDNFGSRVLLDYPLENRASSLQDLLTHGLYEPAPLEALRELLVGGREHPEAAHYHKVFDNARAYPVGPRPTNSCWKAIISSLMAASVLLCRRLPMDVSLHLLVL